MRRWLERVVQCSSRTALVARDGTALAAVGCELGSAADFLGLTAGLVKSTGPLDERRAFITTQPGFLFV